jgi:two-component system, NarL family, invasion response regulator UvrY
VRESDWDAVLLDITMPDMDGIDTLQRIKRSKPDLPVLILTMHPEDQFAINLLRAGANGYMCKDCAPAELADAIRTITSGKRYVSPALRHQLAASLSGADQGDLHTRLSEREFQVFSKLAVGKAVSEIATELYLSAKTISTYRSHVLQKMGFKKNADITYYAIKHGLMQ